jgi:hypothetical protein
MLAQRTYGTQFPNAAVNPQGQPWGVSPPTADQAQVAGYLGRFGYTPAQLNEGPYTDAPRSTMAFGASTNPLGGNPLIVDLPRSDSAALYFRTTTLFADGVHAEILAPGGIAPIRQTNASAFRTSEARTLPSMPVAYAYRGPTRDVQMTQSSRITTLTHWAMGFDFLADLLNAPDGPYKLRLTLAQQNVSALDFFVMLTLTGFMSVKDLMAETWKHRLSQWQQEEGIDAFEFMSNENRFFGMLQSTRRPLEPLMQEVLNSQNLFEDARSDTLIVGGGIGDFVQLMGSYTKYFIAGPAGPARLAAYTSGEVLAAAVLPLRVVVIRPKMVKGYGTFNLMNSMAQTGDFIPFEDLTARNPGARYTTHQRTVFAYNGASDTMEEIPFAKVIANSGRFDEVTDYLREFDLMANSKTTLMDSFYSKIAGNNALHRFFGQQRIEHMPTADTVRISSVMAQNLLGTVTTAEFDQALELLRDKAASIGEYPIGQEFTGYVTAFAAQNLARVTVQPAEDLAVSLPASAAVMLPAGFGALSTPLPPAMGNAVGLWLIHKAVQSSTIANFETTYGFSYEAAIEISRAYTIVQRAQASLQNVFGLSNSGGQYAQSLNVISSNAMHAFLDAAIGGGVPLWVSMNAATSPAPASASASGAPPASASASASGAPPASAGGFPAASAQGSRTLDPSVLPKDQRIHAQNLQSIGLGDSTFIAELLGAISYLPVGTVRSRIAANLFQSPVVQAGHESLDGVPHNIIIKNKDASPITRHLSIGTDGILMGVADDSPAVVSAVLKLIFNAYPFNGDVNLATAIKIEAIRYHALMMLTLIYKKFPSQEGDEIASFLLLDQSRSAVAMMLGLAESYAGGIDVAASNVVQTVDSAYTRLFSGDPELTLSAVVKENMNVDLFPRGEREELDLLRATQQMVTPLIGADGKTFSASVRALRPIRAPARPPAEQPPAEQPPPEQSAQSQSRIGAPFSAAGYVRLPISISAGQFGQFTLGAYAVQPADPVTFADIASAADQARYVAMINRPTANTPGSLLSGTSYRRLPSYIATQQLFPLMSAALPPIARQLLSAPVENARDILLSYVIDKDSEARKQLEAVSKMPSAAQRALSFMFLLCPIRLSVITSMLSENVPIPFTGFALRCYIQFETAGMIACKRGAQNVLLKNMIFTWGQHPQQQSFMGTLSWKCGFVSLDDGIWRIQHALVTGVRAGGFDLSIITGGTNGSAVTSKITDMMVDNTMSASALSSNETARGSVMMMLEPHYNTVGAKTGGVASVDCPIISATGTFDLLAKISGGNIKNKSDRTMYNSAFNMWWFDIVPMTNPMAITESNAEQAASTPPTRYVCYRGLYETVSADGTLAKGKPPTGVFPPSVYKVGITTAIRTKASFFANDTVVDCQ